MKVKKFNEIKFNSLLSRLAIAANSTIAKIASKPGVGFGVGVTAGVGIGIGVGVGVGVGVVGDSRMTAK